MNKNNCKEKLSGFAIPIAQTDGNDLINIELKHEYGVTLISGKPGSGKSAIIRQMLAHMSQNKEKRLFEVFLADTTGYEFSKSNTLPVNIIKGSLFGMAEESIKTFIDMLYAEFVKKRDAIMKKDCHTMEAIPSGVVLIDDIYILLENLSSQKHIDKFAEVITAGLDYGFWFVLLCQDYRYAYMKLPVIVKQVIGQKIYLSPYTRRDIIDFCGEVDIDEKTDEKNKRFSVVVKKNGAQLEAGKLIIPEEKQEYCN